MIRLLSVSRTPRATRKRADTRALQAIKKAMYEQLLAEVQAACIDDIERHEAHITASQHFRQHGEQMN